MFAEDPTRRVQDYGSIIYMNLGSIKFNEPGLKSIDVFTIENSFSGLEGSARFSTQVFIYSRAVSDSLSPSLFSRVWG